MLKNYFTILICVLLGTLTFSSCSSSDDDESASNGSIFVNGEECEIYYTGCSFHGTISDSEGEFTIDPHGSFTMELIYDESLHLFNFSVDNLYSSDIIKVGENYVAEDKVDVTSFRGISSFELSTSYYDEDGKLSISEKGSNYVVVNFDNFSFVKDTGKSETKYTINGKVKYVDINAD